VRASGLVQGVSHVTHCHLPWSECGDKRFVHSLNPCNVNYPRIWGLLGWWIGNTCLSDLI